MVAQIAGLIAVAVIAYWPATNRLWHYWIDHPYLGAHGGLVAVLAAWLLWRARDRVATARIQPVPWALGPLVACSIASLVVCRAHSQLQLLLLPALILLGALAAFGVAVVRATAVPIGFLYFGMPGWNVLSVPLQNLTLAAVKLIAPVIGLPAVFSGYLVSLPGDLTFEVTVWCSGLGFLVQGLAVTTLLGELEHAPAARRLRLVASVAPVALASNWLRVVAIIELGYSTGMRNVLVTRHHMLFGYSLFALVLVVFVWISARQTLPVFQQPAAPVIRPSGAHGPYAAALLALVSGPVLAGMLALTGERPAASRDRPGPLLAVAAQGERAGEPSRIPETTDGRR